MQASAFSCILVNSVRFIPSEKAPCNARFIIDAWKRGKVKCFGAGKLIECKRFQDTRRRMEVNCQIGRRSATLDRASFKLH